MTNINTSRADPLQGVVGSQLGNSFKAIADRGRSWLTKRIWTRWAGWLLQLTGRAPGLFRAVGTENWNAFANENGAPELQAGSVIGRNIFDVVAGTQVQDQLRQAMERVSQDKKLSWVLAFRCDAPERRRNMRQYLVPVFQADACTGFIFQTVELEAHERAPIGLFDFKKYRERGNDNLGPPSLMMCSWCQRVQCDPVSGGEWVEAEEYQAAGGTTNVRISHGICPECLETAADLFLWS